MVGLPALMYDSLSTSLVSLYPLCAAIVPVAFLILVPLREYVVLPSRVPSVRGERLCFYLLTVLFWNTMDGLYCYKLGGWGIYSNN